MLRSVPRSLQIRLLLHVDRLWRRLEGDATISPSTALTSLEELFSAIPVTLRPLHGADLSVVREALQPGACKSEETDDASDP